VREHADLQEYVLSPGTNPTKKDAFAMALRFELAS